MTMRKRVVLTAAFLAAVWPALAGAQAPAQRCDKSKTVDQLAGQIVKINPERNTITVQASDGTTHELEASREALPNFKIGDKIEAKLRTAPNC